MLWFVRVAMEAKLKIDFFITDILKSDVTCIGGVREGHRRKRGKRVPECFTTSSVVRNIC